ncbi:MAG: S-methyl-5-thioribose kinase [Actinomycetota bacterium]
MTDHRTLDVDSVGDYVASRPELAALIDVDTLQVKEVGDGNLNLVFRLHDADGRRLCLKQSLPYVRVAGPSWPLTPERAAAEARGYEAATTWTPETIPTFHGYDADRHVLAMQDLDGWRVWRDVLVDGARHDGIHLDLGRHIARMAFGTSRLGTPGPAHRQAVAAATNVELCEITEDLVLTDPFLGHERNEHRAELDPVIAELRANPRVLATVARAKEAFCTKAEAFVHGDLHSGSVMVRREEDGSSSARVFDIEFCTYGPVGMDLGLLFGNLALAHARWEALALPADDIAWLADLPELVWDAFEAELRALWPDRLDRSLSDEWLDDWLERVRLDAVAFAGCAAVRRIVGFAKSADLESLPADLHLQAATGLLRRAGGWLEDPDAVSVARLLR